MTAPKVSNSCRKAAVSVSRMSSLLGLSRSRFYQLVGEGKFPPPIYNIRTRRPCYSRDLQEICLLIRQTGIAFDNTTIMFNTRRHKTHKRPQQPHVAQKVASAEVEIPNDYNDILEALREMGVQTTSDQITAAIKELYPDGPKDIDEGVMLKELFRFLRKKTA